MALWTSSIHCYPCKRVIYLGYPVSKLVKAKGQSCSPVNCAFASYVGLNLLVVLPSARNAWWQGRGRQPSPGPRLLVGAPTDIS